MNETTAQEPHIVRTGIAGFDDVLCGGLLPYRVYLIEGDPGAGKTTLALQFLLEGVRQGESSMFVTLSESKEELHAAAASHGWSLDGIHILEIIASEESLTPDARYTMFHPSEVELAETTKTVLAEARRIKPDRLVFDSLSELRLLAEHPLRYRRQILALKQHFSRHKSTVMFIDDWTNAHSDTHLHSIAHGVVSLGTVPAEYGALRRRLQVRKLRGCSYREGSHDFVIRKGGLQVFPRLVAAEHRTSYARASVPSGIEQLDRLLGGGLAKGTSTLVMGPSGCGKSSLATQYVVAGAERGEKSAFFLFDESIATLLDRSASLGVNIQPLVDANMVTLRQVDPAEMSPGEFSHHVRQAVEVDGASMIVIDSLTGYLNAMPSDRMLTLHLHELLTYLGQRGVTTLVILTQHGFLGDTEGIDASYLADTVLLLRYFEALGEIRQAISVVKKRTGQHERTIRELKFQDGITVGEPIVTFHGILTGTPELVGSNAAEFRAVSPSDGSKHQ
ncbi:MAG TPA: ATPase domain-containing protein [Gemmatimonadaceae bacterium]|nr:ATPase domain-containing protein [Gemmatimonadaceae bacterium]